MSRRSEFDSAGRRAFFLFLSIHQWRALEQVSRGDATLTDFPKKYRGLAVPLEAKQAYYAQN